MFDQLKIGILGGGQLGAMLMRHAIDLGLQVSILDKDGNVPCSRYTSSFQQGDPSYYDDVMNFGSHLDIITIEKEDVNVAALRDLRDKGVRIYPSPDIIEIIQDKYFQKQFLYRNDIPVVPGVLVNGKAEMIKQIHQFPICLKKCRGGYDGKGVMIIKNENDLQQAFDGPCVMEKFIEVQHEISVIVSRNESGIVECYDPVLMIFGKDRMILDFQICPADIDMDTAMQASNIAKKTAEVLNLVGIMAVEMFVSTDGKLYVNELAPRPHNSGHHTIEACATSQFEQQIRIILGLPMGSTRLNKASVMINILEPEAYRRHTLLQALKTILCTNDAHLHWYGKQGGKEGRKMGHVTITEPDIKDALSKAVLIRHLLKEGYEEKFSSHYHG